MATGSAINLFGSVVHNATPPTAAAINLYASVVHDATPPTAAGINLYASVVHDATPPTAAGINLFGSVVHNAAQISGTVADITGTVGNPATFDGTPMGVSTSSVNYQWSWQSVPSGSAIVNASFPLPDSGSTTPVNMSGNVGLWHFEGNANDTSGEGNNGTVSGATQVAGRVGSNAYSFDGINDYITAPSTGSLQIAGDISIAVWIKADSYAEWESIIQYSNPGEAEADNHLYNIAWANSGGDIRFFWEHGAGSNVQTDFNTNLNTGQWYHLVAVRDTSEMKVYLYLDGVLFDSQIYSNNPTGGTTSQLWIGADSAGYYFDGTIDEVALWNRVLSPLEIDQIYFFQSGSCASGSVGLGETFSFTPDVSGTYSIELGLTDGVATPISGNVDAVISDSPPTPPTGSIISGSNPTTTLVEADNASSGYVFNTNKIDLLSVQRARTSEQVPFILGTKSKQTLRLRTNQDFTGSA